MMQNKPRATKKYFFTALLALVLFCNLPLFAETKNLVYSKAFGIADLCALDISLDYEELHISQIYGDEISIEIESNNINRLPQVQVEEGVLTIKAAKARQTTKALRMEKGNVCRVFVYIPQDFLPDTINVSMKAANLRAEFLRSKVSITLSSITGRIDILSCQTESLTLNNKSGNSSLQKIKADYFDLRSTSGIIFAELAQAPLAKCVIQNQTGKVQLYYPKDAQLPQIDILNKSGRTEINPF